jgi:hypothetical protein
LSIRTSPPIVFPVTVARTEGPRNGAGREPRVR